MELSTKKRTTLAHVHGAVSDVHCVVLEPAPDRCFVLERHQTSPGTLSSEDPTTAWVLHGGTLEKMAPVEFGARPGATGAPLSPDGRFLAVTVWRNKAKGRGAFRTIGFFDRKTGQVVPLERGEASLDVVGWSGAGEKTVAWVDEGSSWDEETPQKAFDFAVLAGTLSPARRAPAGSLERPATSPRGTRRFELSEDGAQLTVTDVGSRMARKLAFHPEDARQAEDACCGWLNERYLSFDSDRLGLIDTDTMKVSFPYPRSEEHRLSFSPDFRFAVDARGRDLYVAEVRPPAETGKAGSRSPADRGGP